MCKYLNNKYHKCGYIFQYSRRDIYEQTGLFESEYFVVCAKCGKHIKLSIEEVQYLTIGRKKRCCQMWQNGVKIMRLDRIPGKKTAAVIGKIFNGMAKESKYTLIPNGDFLHDGTNNPCITNGSFGVYYFTVKELTGFNFAIWMLNIEKFASERYYWTYCVFGAHEHDWNKFKPSRVQCKTSNRIMLDGELNIMFEESVEFSADELFDYIKKEPYLARYRELTSTNCNLEYVSRWKAKRYVQKYDRNNARKERREKAVADRLIKKCSRDLMNIEGVERICLIESNASSPRFHFMISGNLGDNVVSGASYEMFDLDKSQECGSSYAIDDCVSYVEPESFDKKVKQIRTNKLFWGTVTIIK